MPCAVLPSVVMALELKIDTAPPEPPTPTGKARPNSVCVPTGVPRLSPSIAPALSPEVVMTMLCCGLPPRMINAAPASLRKSMPGVPVVAGRTAVSTFNVVTGGDWKSTPLFIPPD
ncbi:MAG: hypothetical protein WA373_13815 [Burkholderiales bacterium]